MIVVGKFEGAALSPRVANTDAEIQSDLGVIVVDVIQTWTGIQKYPWSFIDEYV